MEKSKNYGVLFANEPGQVGKSGKEKPHFSAYIHIDGVKYKASFWPKKDKERVYSGVVEIDQSDYKPSTSESSNKMISAKPQSQSIIDDEIPF